MKSKRLFGGKANPRKVKTSASKKYGKHNRYRIGHVLDSHSAFRHRPYVLSRGKSGGLLIMSWNANGHDALFTVDIFARLILQKSI